MRKLVTYTYADVSTCHISRQDVRLLEEDDPDICAIEYPEGLFVHTLIASDDGAMESLKSRFSEEFLSILTEAYKDGCMWVRFDADAEQYEDRREFDWKE